METLIVAIATDDGNHLPEHHFGEAAFYSIYRFNALDYEFLKRIRNPGSEHEETHGDARKAANIGKLLKPEGVQLLVSRQFGKNIERMRREFLPVLVAQSEIVETLRYLQQNFDLLRAEWQKGSERRHLILR